MNKIAVVGSRGFEDYDLLSNTLYKLSEEYDWHPHSSLFLCGKAKGADSLGERFAKEHYIKTKDFYPEWDIYGKAEAGKLRNMEMANEADYVIAFWDGRSRGTKHMLDISRDYGKVVVLVKYKELGRENEVYTKSR